MLGELLIIEQRQGGLNKEPYGLKPVKSYRFNDLRLFVHDLVRLIERYNCIMFSVGTFTFNLEGDKVSELELWREIADHFDCIEDFDKPFVLWDAFGIRKEFLGMIG